MATRPIQTWNETPSLNNFAELDGGQPEGMQRTNVNDSGRQRMAATSSFYQSGQEWLDLLRDPADRSLAFAVARVNSTTFTVASGTFDASFLFPVKRRLQLLIGSSVQDEVEVVSAVYSNPLVTVTIDVNAGTGTVTSGIDACLLHAMTALDRVAFDGTLAHFIVPADFSDAAVVAALAQAQANFGGIILLLPGTYINSSNWVIGGAAGGVQMWGHGKLVSFIQCTDTSADLHLDLTSGSGLRDLNVFADLSSGAGHIVGTQTVAQLCTLKDLAIGGGSGDAIHFEGTSNGTTIDGVDISSPGRDGIRIEDTNGFNAVTRISNCKIFEPGLGATVKTYGMWIEGPALISNMEIIGLDGGGPQPQTGIYLKERVAVPPNELDAHDVHISNVIVEGTGTGSVGVAMNGRRCTLVGSSILDVSTGVYVGGVTGNQLAEHNIVQSVIFKDCLIGVDVVNTLASGVLVDGNIFDSCTKAIRFNADRGTASGNTIDGFGSFSGIEVLSSATKTIIKNNVIRETVGIGDGIEVQSLSSDTTITGNIIEAPGTGVLIRAGALNVKISENRCDEVIGDAYKNLAGSECKIFNNHPAATQKVYAEPANSTRSSNNETIFAMSDPAEFPTGDGGPDSNKEYIVDIQILVEKTLGTDNMNFRLRLGPLGTLGDPAISVLNIDHSATVSIYNQRMGPLVVKPDSGDVLTLWLNNTAGQTVVIHGLDLSTDPASRMSIERYGDE